MSLQFGRWSETARRRDDYNDSNTEVNFEIPDRALDFEPNGPLPTEHSSFRPSVQLPMASNIRFPVSDTSILCSRRAFRGNPEEIEIAAMSIHELPTPRELLKRKSKKRINVLLAPGVKDHINELRNKRAKMEMIITEKIFKETGQITSETEKQNLSDLIGQEPTCIPISGKMFSANMTDWRAIPEESEEPMPIFSPYRTTTSVERAYTNGNIDSPVSLFQISEE